MISGVCAVLLLALSIYVGAEAARIDRKLETFDVAQLAVVHFLVLIVWTLFLAAVAFQL